MAKYAAPNAIVVVDAAGTIGTSQRCSITRMARLLKVSTSGYYAWRTRRQTMAVTPRQQRRADLAMKIVDVHTDSDGTYGSPRITSELRDRGETVNEKTVAAIMAEIGIEGISPRTFKVRTTVVDPAASFPPDRVQRRFDQGRLDAVWLTDITYLTCGEGDMFLCAIRDGHSRRVLGHVVADHIGADMVCEAIDNAVACRGRSVAGTVLHSDRGGEFTAGLTADACAGHRLKRSMGATGINVGTTARRNRSGRRSNMSTITGMSTLPSRNSLLRLTIGSSGTTIIGVTPLSGCSVLSVTSTP
jgi:putative transposase